MMLIQRILLAVLLIVPIAAQAQLQFDVQSNQTGAVPIAIAPFSINDGLPTDVASVIDADLVRSGLFTTLPRGDMLERPDDPSRVDFRNWRAVGMDHLVVAASAGMPAPIASQLAFTCSTCCAGSS